MQNQSVILGIKSVFPFPYKHSWRNFKELHIFNDFLVVLIYYYRSLTIFLLSNHTPSKNKDVCMYVCIDVCVCMCVSDVLGFKGCYIAPVGIIYMHRNMISFSIFKQTDFPTKFL